MSLPLGGLFDIDGDWKPPHDFHRVGRSVDFTKFYRDASNNNIEVFISDEDGNVIETTGIIDDDDLDKRFSKKDCTRKEKKEGLIHYQCPK